MALRRGSPEIRIMPFRGEYNSRVRKIAPEITVAQTKRVEIETALRGAKSPKLMNVMVSQEVTTIRIGMEAELLSCSNVSQRVCQISNRMLKAWQFDARCD
jgi:hypothetical protein